MELSVLFPEQPSDPDGVLPWARLVRKTGMSRLWMGQSFQIESHMALSRLGAAGLGVPVGIATALAVLRTPYDAALQARSLVAMTGASASIAYGAADPDFVTAVRGEPLRRPASYVAEYTRLVRSLLDGETTSSTFPGLEMGPTVLPEIQPAAAEAPDIEIGIGVLRRGMARKASAVADSAVAWLTPKWYVRDVLRPILDSSGRSVRMAVNVHTALAGSGRNIPLLAQAACQFHVRRLHYAQMLREAGLSVRENDPYSSTRELVERQVFVSGTPDEVATEIESFSAHGVDEVVLNFTGVSMIHGTETALSDALSIMSTINERSDRHVRHAA